MPGRVGGTKPQEFEVGQRLRQLRVERGLSQRELARRAEMTNANLSMIEQGRVSPSIQTLERILRAIPIELGEFFRSDDAAFPMVFERSKQTRVLQPGSEFLIATELHSGSPTVLVQGYLQPGAVVCEVPVAQKDGWLSGIVLRGRLTLMVDHASRELNAGDAFQFHQNRCYRLENQYEDEACVTLAVTRLAGDFDRKV